MSSQSKVVTIVVAVAVGIKSFGGKDCCKLGWNGMQL